MSKQGRSVWHGLLFFNDAFHLESLLLSCGQQCSSAPCAACQGRQEPTASILPWSTAHVPSSGVTTRTEGRLSHTLPSRARVSCRSADPDAPLCAIFAAALSATCASAPPEQPGMGQHNRIVARPQQPLHQACPADRNCYLRGGWLAASTAPERQAHSLLKP